MPASVGLTLADTLDSGNPIEWPTLIRIETVAGQRPSAARNRRRTTPQTTALAQRCVPDQITGIAGGV